MMGSNGIHMYGCSEWLLSPSQKQGDSPLGSGCMPNIAYDSMLFVLASRTSGCVSLCQPGNASILLLPKLTQVHLW